MSLKELRSESGMSQMEVAERSNISWRQYNRYEANSSLLKKASYDTVLRIATCLGLTTDELMHKIDKSPEP